MWSPLPVRKPGLWVPLKGGWIERAVAQISKKIFTFMQYMVTNGYGYLYGYKFAVVSFYTNKLFDIGY